MNKEESLSESLAMEAENVICELMAISHIDLLKQIKWNTIDDHGTPEMKGLVDDLITHFTGLKADKDSEKLSKDITDQFAEIMRKTIIGNIRGFVFHSFLQSLLSSQFSSLEEGFRKELRKKHNLTHGNLVRSVEQTFRPWVYPEEPESKTVWTDWDRIVFLSHYERFLYVVTNARDYFRKLKKQGIREIRAAKLTCDEYQIPENLSEQLFRWKGINQRFFFKKPSEIALDWSQKITGFNGGTEHLKRNILQPAKVDLANFLHKKSIPNNIKLISISDYETSYIDHTVLDTSSSGRARLLKFNRFKEEGEDNEAITFYFIDTKKEDKIVCKFKPGTKEFEECPNCKRSEKIKIQTQKSVFITVNN